MNAASALSKALVSISWACGGFTACTNRTCRHWWREQVSALISYFIVVIHSAALMQTQCTVSERSIQTSSLWFNLLSTSPPLWRLIWSSGRERGVPGGGRVHSLASCMQTSDYLKFNSAYFSVNISCPKEKKHSSTAAGLHTRQFWLKEALLFRDFRPMQQILHRGERKVCSWHKLNSIHLL